MHTTSIYHRLAAFAAVTMAMLGIGFPISAHAATFPPLNVPVTGEAHPGKFVWAELFTDDSTAATNFYSGVFGWTFVTLVDEHGVAYTVFSNGNHPVAGLRQRSPSATKRVSRWINYISVTDIESTLSTVAKAGGVVRAPAREFPHIGSQAIITDIEGSPVGLIQSSSGDSADDEPVPGEWNWFHLLAKNPQAAADFYRQVFTYNVASDDRAGKTSTSIQLLLSSGGVNRGGVSALPDREDAKTGWLGIIRVENLDRTLVKATLLGGEIVVAPHEAAFGSRFALITDPTGGTVGLVEYLNNANPVTRP